MLQSQNQIDNPLANAAFSPASLVLQAGQPNRMDTFITPDPTPKPVSRRAWRRRRMRKGKT